MTMETDQPTSSGPIEIQPAPQTAPTKKGKEVKISTNTKIPITSLTIIGGNKPQITQTQEAEESEEAILIRQIELMEAREELKKRSQKIHTNKTPPPSIPTPQATIN
jgi:hypothetical protein